MTHREESDWLRQVSPSLRRAHRAARWLFVWLAKAQAAAYHAYWFCPDLDDPDLSSEERERAIERYSNPMVRLLIRGRDILPRATRSIMRVADEFAAASYGVVSFGDTYVARSCHELPAIIASFWLTECERAIAADKNSVPYPRDVPDNHIDTVTEADIRKYVGSGLKWVIEHIEEPPGKSDLRWYLRRMKRELRIAHQHRIERKRQLDAERGTLSDAEKRIVEVVRQAGKRLRTEEILNELERQYGAASQGTTKVCLASLVRRKWLTNRQDVIPKGYGLYDRR